MATELQPVESRNLAAVGYDPATECLTVQFRHGATYAYTPVPPALHAALLAADSIGGYFAAHVKPAYPLGAGCRKLPLAEVPREP